MTTLDLLKFEIGIFKEDLYDTFTFGIYKKYHIDYALFKNHPKHRFKNDVGKYSSYCSGNKKYKIEEL